MPSEDWVRYEAVRLGGWTGSHVWRVLDRLTGSTSELLTRADAESRVESLNSDI